MFVAIDPGVNGCGVAWFHTSEPHGNKLYCAAYLKGSPAQVFADIDEIQRPPDEGLSFIVCETPQVYQGRKQTGDPNDLIDLAMVVGQLWGWAEAHKIGFVVRRPCEWKGQLPKEVCHRRILQALTSEEQTRITSPSRSMLHNVLDAVGIGLWNERRLNAVPASGGERLWGRKPSRE